MTAFERDITAQTAGRSVSLPSRAKLVWDTVDAFLARDHAWLIAICCAAILQSALVVTHQPWLDEWQALQISLQSPSLSGLFDNLRYEGHPPLWYLLLRSVAQVVPPAWVLAAVQLPIALAIQWLILCRLPLSRFERLLLACSPYVLIDYGAIARSLGLGVLLVLAATLYRERRASWLALAALPMVDFFFGVLSLAIIGIAWREKRLWASGLAVWGACGAAAAWFVRPAPDMIPALWLNGPIHDGLVELARFGALLVPLAIADGHLVWNETPCPAAALSGGLVFIALGLWLLRRDRFFQAMFGAFVALIFTFSMFVYPLAIRHVSLALVLLIVLIVLQPNREGDERRFLDPCLALGALCGIAMGISNLVRPFDTAPSAAAYILDHHLEGEHWVSFPDSRGQGVSALTGIEFERLERGCTQSFIRWNYRSRIKQPRDLEQELERVAARSGGFYLLTDFNLLDVPIRNAAAYQQLFYVPAGVDGQPFYLYRVRADLPKKGAPLPQCAPKRLPMPALLRA